MKKLTQIFQALLAVAALILTALVATGRLSWQKIRKWWSSHSRTACIAIVALLILVPVGFVTLVAYSVYTDKYGRDFYDRRLSANVVLHSFSNNQWRVYNHKIGDYTTDKINWLSEVSKEDSLAVYAIPNRRGYINVNTGHVVIDAQENNYRMAWVFSEGLAAVMKDGKIGFINADNEVVIPFQFDYSEEIRKWDVGYLFHDGYCVMTNKEGLFGLIDTAGEWVVAPMYDEIWAPHASGYRVIVKNGKYGILDSICNVVYPAEYGYIDVLSDSFVLTKRGKKWQVDFEGNIVQPFMYDSAIDLLCYPVAYGNDDVEFQHKLSDFVKYEVLNRYGILNRITGKPITPAIYSEINMPSKNLFEVQDPESYNWHLIDTQGNVVSKK